MLETAGKVLDFAAKKSWATFFLALLVLCMPDGVAEQTGISELRNPYKGYWGLLLIFSGILWIGSISRSAWGSYSRWKEKKEKENLIAKKKNEELSVLVSRLSSLSREEKLWIQYCLYYNTQTFSAQRTDTIAQSLVFKGLLREGSGSILDLPFHIPDEVWSFLRENEAVFLPDAIRNDPNFPRFLEAFSKRRKFLGY